MKYVVKSGLYFAVFVIMLDLLQGITVSGQGASNVYDLFSMLENGKLDIFNREISPFAENEERGIRFSGNRNDGIAWLRGVEFSDGIIDLDIKGKDVLQQSFVVWHFMVLIIRHLMQYISDPSIFSNRFARRIHAVQYVSHPDNTWFVLRQNYNGKYEKAIIPPPDPDKWFHVRIVIRYPQVSVYVNNSPDPSLVVDQLNERRSGKIGLWVGNNSDGDFANLKITSF